MANFIWKINRLRLMGAAEILWRVKRELRRGFTIRSRMQSTYPPQSNNILGRSWVTALSINFDKKFYLEAADHIMIGQYDVFALKAVRLGFPPDWYRDPKSGTRAPQVYGEKIDYRNNSIVGDIKYTWEINRHYELVTLAQAWHLSREEKYAFACREYLQSWFDKSPHLFGLGWTSALENSVRLANWAVSWQLLNSSFGMIFKGEEGQLFKKTWEDSIYQHCHFICENLSLYSSGNNHLFGEYMGLFIGSVTWPCWEESAKWKDVAKEGLETQVLEQISSDGVHREQAIWYQHEVADMMVLCGLIGRGNDVEFSKTYWRRLELMLQFILSMMDVRGNVPMIGDSDDAVIVRFSKTADVDVYRSLLTTGAVIFGREDFKRKSIEYDGKSRWLLGDGGEEIYRSLCGENSTESIIRAFPLGGYYILGDELNTSRETRIIVDAGALGYLSIAAHGHSDALAFSLSVSGIPFLVDPGTYAYHTEKIWRDYFRGTSAHNTIRVDGADQSKAGGAFMWLQKANARCDFFEITEDTDIFVGSHDGYTKLRDPLIHSRKITFLKANRTIVVEDILNCKGVHDIEFHWHFSNSCQLGVDGARIRAFNEGFCVELTMEGVIWEPQIITGRESPPLGWFSRRLDEKIPAPTVLWKERINGTSRRFTVFQLSKVSDSSFDFCDTSEPSILDALFDSNASEIYGRHQQRNGD